MHIKHELSLVRLSDEQIARAKAANGPRKHITHVLLCGPYGQIFGSEKQCRKYFDVWLQVFPRLFAARHETHAAEVVQFESTFNLVHRLIAVQEELERGHVGVPGRPQPGLIARLFGRRD